MTMASKAAGAARFAGFIRQMTAVVESFSDDEPMLLDAAEPLLADLVRNDDWLPARFAVPSDQSYRQYLLYRDPRNRFSVVSFVWQPGQQTPVHDHTVWGLVGVLRGQEHCEEFLVQAEGLAPRRLAEHPLLPGAVDRVSPRIGDVHRVSNSGEVTAVSIHVYGADIGAISRHVFDESTGAVREFVSGYSNGDLGTLLPS